MKRTNLLILFLAGFLTVGVMPQLGFAFGKSDKDIEAKMEKRSEQRVEKLTKALELTDSQQKEVRAIFEKQKTEIKALRKETKAKIKTIREDTRSKLKGYRDASNKEIRALLNSEQVAKFDKIVAEREKKMKEHKGQWSERRGKKHQSEGND